MALSKRVKVGGSYYKGYKLVVSAAAASYQLDMALSVNSAINGIMIIPDALGVGDTFKLEHLTGAGTLKKTLAETIYNIGAYAGWNFDLATLEPMDANDILRLTYTNVAGNALNVYTSVEYAGVQ